MIFPLAACLPLAAFVATATSDDAIAESYPRTLDDMLTMYPNLTLGDEVPHANSIPTGCVDKNGSACLQYSLPMAQAFTALANAGQCGPNPNLKSWTCAACRTVGFDVVPASVKVVTGREVFQGQSTSIYVAQVKGSFPGSKPRPAEALMHTGEDCWQHCRHTEGYCDWCGVGNVCVAKRSDSNATGHHCAKPSWNLVAKAAVSNGGQGTVFGCVLSVRGSKNLDNWVMNFDFPMESMKFGDQCPKCRGVMGWLRSYHEIEHKIMSSLDGLGCLPGSPFGNLLITGHSFGGSLATLAMFHLQRKGYNVVQSYNFEATRVGDKAWSAAFQTAFGRDVPVFRVTHSADVVPRLPPQLGKLHLGLAYEHVASEVFFPGEDKNTNVICEAAEDKRCADRESWAPALATSLKRKFRDHCSGPLGEYNDFCHCPVNRFSESAPEKTYIVV
jgi:hypothetical protein